MGNCQRYNNRTFCFLCIFGSVLICAMIQKEAVGQIPKEAFAIWEENSKQLLPQNIFCVLQRTETRRRTGKAARQREVSQEFGKKGKHWICKSVYFDEVSDTEVHEIACLGPDKKFVVQRGAETENWTILEAADVGSDLGSVDSLATEMASSLSVGYRYRGIPLAELFQRESMNVTGTSWVNDEKTVFKVEFNYESDELKPPFFMKCEGYFLFLPKSRWQIEEVKWQGTNTFKQTFDKVMETRIKYADGRINSFTESSKGIFPDGNISEATEVVLYKDWDQVKFEKKELFLENYGVYLRRPTPWWRKPGAIMIGLGATVLVFLVGFKWKVSR